MPRLRKWPPPIYVEDGMERCKIWLGGRRRTITLGPAGSAEARAAYARLLAEADGNGGQPLPRGAAVLVMEVCAAYLTWAAGYHEIRQLHRMRVALAPVASLYGRTRAAEFGPVALEACRQSYVKEGYARDYCNTLAAAVRTVWRWAASREMVPAAVAEALVLALPLRRGRTEAPERPRIRPADPAAVEQTLPQLPPITADLIRVIQLTGARPGEICAIRPADVDRRWLEVNGIAVWLYRCDEHKNDWRGALRWIPIGPQAQGVLAPYLLRDPEAYCFSPREVVAQWCAEHDRRFTLDRRSRIPGEQYTTQSLDRIIAKARRRAGARRWTPNQLRHSLATRLEVELGREDARCVLGHSTPTTTAIYAESVERAGRVMARLG